LVIENKLTQENLKPSQDPSMTVSSGNTQIYSSMASASTFVPTGKNNTKHDEAKRKVEKVADKKKEAKENREKGKAKVVGRTSVFFFPNPANKPSPTESINPKPIPSIDSAPDPSLPVGRTSAFFLPNTANKPSRTESINPQTIPSIDSAPDPSLPVDHDEYDSGGPGSENEVNNEDGDGSFIVNPACLIDIEKKPVNNSKNGGRPMHSLLNDLVQKCYNTERPEKHIFHCKGGCGKTFSNRNGARIIRHATGCHRLPAELRKQAKAEVASKAPSRQLDIDDPESTKIISETSDVEQKGKNKPGGVVVMKKRKLDEVVEVGGVSVKSKLQKTTSESSSPFFEKAKALGRKDRHRKLDLAVVKLFCCSGIPTYISDLDVWKDLIYLADPTYSPASRAKLEEVQIIGEAESIQQIQTTYLRTKDNLTVSCDGGTAIGGASFFTVHVSTEERKVYLMEVREATAESHTAVWIKDLVLEVRVQFCLNLDAQ
jgi:hypothetical protein